MSASYQIGYLLGTLLTPILFMLLIGTIYFFIKKGAVSFRQAVLNRWVITASIVLFVLGLVGRTHSNLQQDASHVYPDREVKGFTEGCVEKAKARLDSAVAEKICSCAIADIQKTYTYGEFKKIGTELEATKNLPAGVQNILASCAKKELGSQKS